MVNIKSTVVTVRLSSGGKDKEHNVEYEERHKKGDIVKINSEISAEILKRKRNMIVSLKLFKIEEVNDSKDESEK